MRGRRAGYVMAMYRCLTRPRSSGVQGRQAFSACSSIQGAGNDLPSHDHERRRGDAGACKLRRQRSDAHPFADSVPHADADCVADLYGVPVGGRGLVQYDERLDQLYRRSGGRSGARRRRHRSGAVEPRQPGDQQRDRHGDLCDQRERRGIAFRQRQRHRPAGAGSDRVRVPHHRHGDRGQILAARIPQQHDFHGSHHQQHQSAADQSQLRQLVARRFDHRRQADHHDGVRLSRPC